MIRYMIKNNLKLMFRSPANIILFILMPILVSSVLASAFSALMKSYENKTPFDVGYCMEQLRRMGFPVYVIDGVDQIGGIIDEICSA